MTAINSKNKGNTNERRISKLLSSTFYHYTLLESAFFRNASSGAFFGGKNQFRTQTHDKDHQEFGDIICPKNFKFTIECKHYKSPPSWKAVSTQQIKQWDTWIAQASQDATNAGKKMLLIIKYNNCDDFVIVADSYDVPCFGHYKGYNLYLLSDFLTISIEKFFDEKS